MAETGGRGSRRATVISSNSEVRALPQRYVGRDDVMGSTMFIIVFIGAYIIHLMISDDFTHDAGHFGIRSIAMGHKQAGGCLAGGWRTKSDR